MKVVRGAPSTWNVSDATAVTVGVYDGVHRGHQVVLRRLTELASERALVPTVLTFDPHPLAVVAPERAPELLTTLEQRLELFEELGIEVAAILSFDAVMRALPPETFAAEVLADALRARLIVVGEDFRFGRDRAGDVALLDLLGPDLGFTVDRVALVTGGGGAISSTLIRRAIRDGDVEAAASRLGRCPELRGEVVRGDGRGRLLGYPTANLAIPEGLVVPAKGVYAGRAGVNGERHLAAISVGIRPTFETDRRLVVEGHLLDFDRDIYGERIGLFFCHRLRDEEKFETVDELVAQMGLDVDRVRHLMEDQPS